MKLLLCIVVTMIILHVCQSSECGYKNVSCNNIRTIKPPGFAFPLLKCSAGIEVSASYNQTVIALANPKEQVYNWLRAVISMNNSSIVTSECRDLIIMCTIHDGQYINDICEEFKIIERDVNPAVSPVWISMWIAVLLSTLPIIGVCFWCFKRKKHGAYGVSRSLQFCCYHRERGSQFSDPSRHREEGQGVETPRRDFSLIDIPLHEPHGGGGNEQDNTTGTAPALTELNDDGGGASTVRTTNLNSGCAHGDRGPEGQPLLLRPQAAGHSSDMTAEGEALVNKHDSDPGQASRCSAAQNNNVESNPR